MGYTVPQLAQGFLQPIARVTRSSKPQRWHRGTAVAGGSAPRDTVAVGITRERSR